MGELANRRKRDRRLLERLPGERHPREGRRKPNRVAGGGPRRVERRDEPGGRREMAVALEQPPARELVEPSESLRLELLERAMQLGDVLLDPRVRTRGQVLAPELVDDRSELAHPHTSNIGSNLP